MAQKTESNGMLHGTLDALILKTLSWGVRHGYGIAKWIEEATDEAVIVEEGSLYPALYRMERRGLADRGGLGRLGLGRKAKFYRITAKGRRRARGRYRAMGPVRDRRIEEGAAASMKFGQRLRSRFWRARVEDEVDAELSFHVEMRARELVEQGMPPADAREAAIRRFGDINRVNATCRAIGRQRDHDMRRTEYFAELGQDVSFACRHFWRPLAPSPSCRC